MAQTTGFSYTRRRSNCYRDDIYTILTTFTQYWRYLHNIDLLRTRFCIFLIGFMFRNFVIHISIVHVTIPRIWLLEGHANDYHALSWKEAPLKSLISYRTSQGFLSKLSYRIGGSSISSSAASKSQKYINVDNPLLIVLYIIC